MIRFGSLFAGIGGFDLGFERAGMQCAWQVEIDGYCQQVLEKHWPDVRRWDDVRTFPPKPVDDWRVDVVCGGFPCQDISYAGKGAGIDGERSGLWKEFARVIRVLRPQLVVVENSPAIHFRGLDRILGDLATMGFDAEWGMLSACAFGAPHMRKRMFIVANVDSDRVRTSGATSYEAASAGFCFGGSIAQGRVAEWWSVQPEPCSVVYGFPGIVDELRPYGNAVVPQVAEWIGRRIVEAFDAQPTPESDGAP